MSSHHVLFRAFGDAYFRRENVRHATFLFRAGGVNVQIKAWGNEERMDWINDVIKMMTAVSEQASCESDIVIECKIESGANSAQECSNSKTDHCSCPAETLVVHYANKRPISTDYVSKLFELAPYVTIIVLACLAVAALMIIQKGV